MIPRTCRRLAEVDFPVAEVSRHASWEKSIRHGHPSTLHMWWARRPLASSRAVLLALLLPDPCDERCPEDFRKQARALLAETPWEPRPGNSGLRHALLKFIGDFANWDNVTKKPWFSSIGRGLVKAAHTDTPLVVDPFAGGGSIPLEALRLGCDAFASDLNPVACLILKVMLEDIPRHGPALAKELRWVGDEIKARAKADLTGFYPADADGARPIAYLWARTVRCESPNCGAEIPLMRSLWLRKKPKRGRALRTKVVRPRGKPPRVEFEIFEPLNEEEKEKADGGTVTRARATCLCCGTVLPPDRVRAQLAAEKGGADVVFDGEGERIGGARMTAVVTLMPREQEHYYNLPTEADYETVRGRRYRLPTKADYAAVRESQRRLREMLDEWERGGRQGLCPVPDEPAPTKDRHRAVGSQIPLYGITSFGDLFTARQKVALVRFGREVPNLPFGIQQTLVALLLGRMADGNNSLARWGSDAENPVNLFARQAIPMVWDFCESTPESNARGVFLSGVDAAYKVIDSARVAGSGQVQSVDATHHPLPDETANVWFTDPPYYDAIPYADLSDFFLVWLKRTLPEHPFLRDHFDPANILSPKEREAVQDETKRRDGQVKDRNFFEDAMARAFTEGRRVLNADGIGAVVFAHKTTEGWEALLSGMINGGWTITGSWPIATESGSRLNARETASLATSVHLICRPRDDAAGVGDWADVLRELPGRVGNWMERLQKEGVHGADLVFACIGPALEIFSRYRKVETPAGEEVTLTEYLERVWEVVGRTVLGNILGTAEAQARNGGAGALEEDARLTALFLWSLQNTTTNNGSKGKDEGNSSTSGGTFKGLSCPYDLALRFAQPMGIKLEKWDGRIIEKTKGVVRLLPVAERAKQLFGEEGAAAAAEWLERDPMTNIQTMLFQEAATPAPRRRRGSKRPLIDETELQSSKATTLDRVHAAMLFQSGGRTNALRNLIKAEQARGPDFIRLANSLSALYPSGSKEKRLLEAMLLAVPK